MKDVDTALWHQAVGEESRAPPQFYPHAFHIHALHILREGLNMCHYNITPESFKAVYLYLINNW